MKNIRRAHKQRQIYHQSMNIVNRTQGRENEQNECAGEKRKHITKNDKENRRQIS